MLDRAAWAQDDYFPPPGIFIPCCSPGGTGGYTGATYGENGQSAWRQVWGAAPGDVVTFRFVLRARSAGSLHAWPQTTGGDGMTYIGDPNNPYEKWYWNTGQRSSGGTFCIDCPWQFTANYWNPWIYVEYWDSGDGWDVDLNIVNIQTPQKSWLALFTDPDKNTAGGLSNAFSAMEGFWMGSGSVLAGSDWKLGAILGAASWVAGKLAGYYDKIHNDPWDGDFCSDSWGSYYGDTSVSWVRDYDPWSGGWFITSIEQMTAAGNMASTAIDRAASAAAMGEIDCGFARRDEAMWALHEMGAWMGYFQWSLQTIADQNPDIDMSAIYGTLWLPDWGKSFLGGLQ